ncbi:MAG: uracil-DNA glycosylase [Planctomycetota bacterium]|nr:uracil-DNA glycosylase [Planctomycetota bacterium]
MTDPSATSDLRAEARLWLEWARGAAGPWLPAEMPAPLLKPRPKAATQAAEQGAGAGAQVAEVISPEERDQRMARMATEVAACTRCVLAGDRHSTVFGEGSHAPKLVIVGEAPGAEEDRSGRPFVGPAGQLLTKMLAAIGLAREDVFICNLLKCRPPGNRNPRPEEVAACKPFLREQLRLLQPPLILALGSPAARELLQTSRGIMSLRGRFSKTPDGYRVMPTFHPAYLLRRPEAKRDVWNDLKKVAGDLGLEIATKQRG